MKWHGEFCSAKQSLTNNFSPFLHGSRFKVLKFTTDFCNTIGSLEKTIFLWWRELWSNTEWIKNQSNFFNLIQNQVIEVCFFARSLIFYSGTLYFIIKQLIYKLIVLAFISFCKRFTRIIQLISKKYCYENMEILIKAT